MRGFDSKLSLNRHFGNNFQFGFPHLFEFVNAGYRFISYFRRDRSKLSFIPGDNGMRVIERYP